MFVSIFDIRSAYLKADLEEETYLAPFPGVTPPRKGMVMKLIHPLYGLCQAGRSFYKHLHKTMTSMGLVRRRTTTACTSTPIGPRMVAS